MAHCSRKLKKEIFIFDTLWDGVTDFIQTTDPKNLVEFTYHNSEKEIDLSFNTMLSSTNYFLVLNNNLINFGLMNYIF